MKKLNMHSSTHKLFHTQIGFGTAFLYLTSGVFLSGLAMLMGANDLLVSYISMITNICGISILFFSSFMERFQSFKKAAIGLTVLSKLATLLIVLIPLFVPKDVQLMVFVPVMIVAFTLQSQTTVIINNWLVVFADDKQSGRYIARRQTIVLIVTVILSLSAGRLIDAVSGAYIGFALLFLAAFVMAVSEVLVLLLIPDAKRERSEKSEKRFSDIIRVPIKNRKFLFFVIYIFIFYLSLSFSDSFTVVYMMRYLELPYINTTALQMIMSLPQLFLLGIWGRISDKKGHKFALSASIWFFVGETFFLAMSNSQTVYIFIPIAFLFAAIGNSGFLVSVFNRRYELMPKEGRILYDNFYTAAIGLAFILGPLVGGAVKDLLESNVLLNSDFQFANIRILYLISAVAIVTLQFIMQISNYRKKQLAKE